MGKASKATPSAGRRGPEALLVGTYGVDPSHPCPDCGGCEVTNVRATASRAPVGSERFDAAHLIDGNPSSAWCSAPTPGALPAVTFDVPRGCRVHGLSILGGHFGDRTRLAKNGRVAELSLAAGRLRGDAEVDDPIGLKTNFRSQIAKPASLFAGWTAYDVDELTVTLRVEHPGSMHRGVCLSELRPVLSGAPDNDGAADAK